jgi:hypothetical protein
MGRPTKRALKSGAMRPVLMASGMAREVQAMQQAVIAATKEARQDPFSRGRSIRVTFAGAESKKVSHGLGRKPVGVVPRTAPAGEAMAVGTTEITSRMVTFTSSAAGTVEFWVY